MPHDVTTPERRLCQLCGGDLRFSHREYAGGRRSRLILRCLGCGNVVRGQPQEDAGRSRQVPRKQRAPIDEGRPENPVLDPGVADRLRQAMDAESGAGEA